MSTTVVFLPVAAIWASAAALFGLAASIPNDQSEAQLVQERLDKWAVKIAKCFQDVNHANLEFAKRVTAEFGDIREEIKRLDGRIDKLKIDAIMREYDQHIMHVYHVNTAFQLMIQTPFSKLSEYRLKRNKFESYCGKDQPPIIDNVLGYLFVNIVEAKDPEKNLLEVFSEHIGWLNIKTWFSLFIQFRKDAKEAYDLSLQCDNIRNISMTESDVRQIAYLRSGSCDTASITVRYLLQLHF